MRLRRLLPWLVLLGLGAWTTPARAQIVHVVERGDTLTRLASHYYGAGNKAAYLAGVNQIGLDSKLKPGQKLKVAVVWSYRVRRGDRLPAIARKVLGDERRYPYLARFNDVEDMARLPAGTRVLVPIEIRHKLARGENLGLLARRYYRNTRKASLLRDYNFLGKKPPSAGDTVIVPLFDKTARLSEVKRRMKAEAARAAKPEKLEKRPVARKPRSRPEKKGTPEPAPAAPEPTATATATGSTDPAESVLGPAIDGALKRSEKALRRGAYEEAVEALDPIVEEVPDRDLRRQRRMRMTLATALTALGRRGEATEHLQRLIELDPDTTLDPVTTSPKVMEAFQRAQEAWSEDSGERGRDGESD